MTLSLTCFFAIEFEEINPAPDFLLQFENLYTSYTGNLPGFRDSKIIIQ